MLGLIVATFRRLLFFAPAPVADSVSFELISSLRRRTTGPLVLGEARPRFLNLGSGPRVIPGLVNVDFFGTPGIDFGADLRYPLRIPDASIDGIFTEHTLEHLSYGEADALLAECHRILGPGGTLRVVLPDLSPFLRSYSSGDARWFAEWERLMFTESLDPERARRRLASPLEAISFVTQEYGHRSSWDVPTLRAHLERAGFLDVEVTGFRQGRVPELLVDCEEQDRRFVSLYVEARK